MTFKLSDKMAAGLKLVKGSPEFKAMEAEANRQIEALRKGPKDELEKIARAHDEVG